MKKYIDADRLRVEIEQRLDKLNPKVGMFGDRPLRAVNPKTFPRESELEKVLGLIDSLQREQPEVDLKKELDRYLRGEFQQTAGGNFNNYIQVARHFYGLRNRALEEAARRVYESWMGGTMDDVRRDMVELDKVLYARKV